MTHDDIAIRALGHTFDTLSERRLRLDPTGDDVARADMDAEWLACCRQIITLKARTEGGWAIKAKVLLALIEATGASGPAIDAARSLAADLVGPRRSD